MTPRRFKNLPRLQVWRQGSGGNSTFKIPPDGLLEVDEVVDLLGDIRDAHDDDLRSTGGYNRHEATEAFRRRTIWRFGSHVVFSCTAVGIIERLFDIIGEQGENSIDGYVRQPFPDAHQRSFEVVRLWRDKVFAHTAFASPKRKATRTRSPDNMTDQLTSLAMLVGQTFLILDDGDIALGGAQVRADGPGNHELARMNLASLHNMVTRHLDGWWDILNGALQPFAAATLPMMQARDPQITRLYHVPQ